MSLDFAVAVFATDETPDPATIARMTEERGFESLFFPEHTHIPASRKSPWPGGAELPRVMEALTTAGAQVAQARYGAARLEQAYLAMIDQSAAA